MLLSVRILLFYSNYSFYCIKFQNFRYSSLFLFLFNIGKETKLEEKKEVEEEKEEKEESFPSQQLICATFKKDENNRYVCPKCKRTYMHKCNLYKHLKYRCGTEAQFACPICERPFSHKFSLKSHTIAVHQVVFDHVILKDPVN